MDAKKLGAFIAERRKELGMTQAGLADKLHVTDKAISKWERGLGLPDINTFEPLAEALAVNITELMRGERSADTLSAQESSDAVKNALDLAARKQAETRRIVKVSLGAAVSVICAQLLRRPDETYLFYVLLPLIGFAAGIALLFAAGILNARDQGLPVKRTALTGAVALLVSAVFIFVTSWPVYESFIKPVGSYTSIRRALADKADIRYPDWEAAGLKLEGFVLHVDKRSLLAKPTGYILSGSKSFDGVKALYNISVEPDIIPPYVDEPLRRWEHDLRDEIYGDGKSVEAEITASGYTYHMDGVYREKDITPERRAEVDCAMADYFDTLCGEVAKALTE